MPQLRVKLNGKAVDGWLAEISAAFPEAEFRILATQLRDEGALGILEVRTREGNEVVERFDQTAEVDSFEMLHIDDQMVLLRFLTNSSRAYDPLFKSKSTSLYPTILQDGWFTVRLVASRERLAKYVAELAAADIPYQVLSVTQSNDVGEILTERQWKFVTEAVERGYYDTPRGCTLSELAEVLSIHKSAASRLRHRAECRIVKAFVAEAG
ncbi:helix-turn-helix domain-containing protein [Halegenticoccus tardaugens]|uniref:helix-turn-helix domain-containing protein n=1 Tax=Halegenticoccus tardaugens TaxID=2071624 RepID=UPI00100B8483|nr:helix-turn-helix domain-containing protein [Halegenticoccus tardaugens]